MLRFFLVFFLLLLLGMGAGVYLLIDTRPDVAKSEIVTVDNADKVRALLRQVKQSLDDSSAQQTIVVTNEQMGSLVGFAQRAIPGFSGDVRMAKNNTQINASIHLPQPLDDYFINLEALVLPGPGVDIDYIRIGDLSVPGDMALAAAVRVTDWFTKSSVASTAATHITKVSMSPQQMVLDLRPLDGLLAQIEIAREELAVEEDSWLQTQTAVYLAYMVNSPLATSTDPQSLADYLSLLMTYAQSQSDETNAFEHNQAVIMALAIFVGDYRMASLVGGVQLDSHELAKPRHQVVLAQRNDLARHFVISAALQVFSQQNMTMAIGEFKELMDRALGGSGYSFVDLTADMAGMAFANAAADPNYARRVQYMLAGHAEDNHLLPNISGLPEGLSKVEFSRRYEDVDSPAYKDEIRTIHTRLQNLRLYQLVPPPWPSIWDK
jgi:hypothetical protein